LQLAVRERPEQPEGALLWRLHLRELCGSLSQWQHAQVLHLQLGSPVRSGQGRLDRRQQEVCETLRLEPAVGELPRGVARDEGILRRVVSHHCGSREHSSDSSGLDNSFSAAQHRTPPASRLEWPHTTRRKPTKQARSFESS